MCRKPPNDVERLRQQSTELVSATVDRFYRRVPELATRYGSIGRQRCLDDGQYHLLYLAEAAELNSPLLFADYVQWAGEVLAGRKIPLTDLIENLRCLREVLNERFTTAESTPFSTLIDVGISQLESGSLASPPSIKESSETIADEYLTMLLQGRRNDAVNLINGAIAGGRSIKEIYLKVFQRVQHEIGRLWQTNEISVAEEHYCTAVTQLIMSQLYPQILAGPKNGRVLVCACIGGDLHEIGSRMIADFFELEGWDTYFLGANTPLAGIVQQVRTRKPDVVALSATMTYHLSQVRATIQAIRKEASTKILVGGRPFNIETNLWRQVGADATGRDAEDAIGTAQSLLA